MKIEYSYLLKYQKYTLLADLSYGLYSHPLKAESDDFSQMILPFWICFNKSKNDERPIKPLQFSLAQKCLSKNRSFKIEFLSQRSLMPARVSFEVAIGICPLLLTLTPYPDYNRIIGAWHLWTVMSKSVLLWQYLELN